jgi:hypothetical protein
VFPKGTAPERNKDLTSYEEGKELNTKAQAGHKRGRTSRRRKSPEIENDENKRFFT